MRYNELHFNHLDIKHNISMDQFAEATWIKIQLILVYFSPQTTSCIFSLIPNALNITYAKLHQELSFPGFITGIAF